ncbi:hypothetical protein GCM10009805_13550 [Leucobacter chromiireducens subsp. solipictus]
MGDANSLPNYRPGGRLPRGGELHGAKSFELPLQMADDWVALPDCSDGIVYDMQIENPCDVFSYLRCACSSWVRNNLGLNRIIMFPEMNPNRQPGVVKRKGEIEGR